MAGVKAELTCLHCGAQNVSLTPIKFRDGRLAIQTMCLECKNKSFLGQNQPNDIWTMPFGKYKGKTVVEIAEEDPKYCQWAAENIDDEKIRARFEAEL